MIGKVLLQVTAGLLVTLIVLLIFIFFVPGNNKDTYIDNVQEQFDHDIGNKKYQFLSWYDGWGTYTVWGVGELHSIYISKVSCGGVDYLINPVYDTHSSREIPKPNQTSDFAEAYNKLQLIRLKQSGLSCNFRELEREYGELLRKALNDVEDGG